ncbi:hypothetical protein ACH35V_17405 [Actinomadura sp. 1N219]|uniref:hypothetical protein n=1 Tax=Actinomadura sp. 1N219 TaxID=3375152 RepID=UPI0037ABDFE7
MGLAVQAGVRPVRQGRRWSARWRIQARAVAAVQDERGTATRAAGSEGMTPPAAESSMTIES